MRLASLLGVEVRLRPIPAQLHRWQHNVKVRTTAVIPGQKDRSPVSVRTAHNSIDETGHMPLPYINVCRRNEAQVRPRVVLILTFDAEGPEHSWKCIPPRFCLVPYHARGIVKERQSIQVPRHAQSRFGSIRPAPISDERPPRLLDMVNQLHGVG